jgi:gamma-glutamylcyclotransferase (GGCT)/AIG2-like uncharacterized protein YtfP
MNDLLRQTAALLAMMDDARWGDGRASAQATRHAANMSEQLSDQQMSYDDAVGQFFGETDSDDKMVPVFVYGTLKEGYTNGDYFLDGHRFRPGAVRGFALAPVSSFPGAIPCEGGNMRGELVEVDEHTFARIDALEGYPDMYTRELVSVRLDDGGHGYAWTYVWNGGWSESGSRGLSNEWPEMEPIR